MEIVFADKEEDGGGFWGQRWRMEVMFAVEVEDGGRACGRRMEDGGGLCG